MISAPVSPAKSTGMADTGACRFTLPPKIQAIISMAMWPLAIMTVLHRTFLMPYNASETDDFSAVLAALRRFRAGLPVYDQNLESTDPHYLYSPGGTLLLCPLTIFNGDDFVRAVFITLNALAAVLAVLLLVKLFGFSLRGPVVPTLLFVLFNTESIQNTLLFSNINAILLLLEVVFLWGMLRRHNILAGIALGLAATVKPQFLPLVVLPLFRRQWSTAAVALSIPVVTNIIGFRLVVDTDAYVHVMLPYLQQVRDYANSSLAGLGVYLGLPGWNILLWRVAGALIVGTALFLLLRWRDRDELMWAATTSGAIIIGVSLLSSLGQMYYTMIALPLFLTVLRSRSVMHNPAIWLGVYLTLSMDLWSSEKFRAFGLLAEAVRGPLGWTIIMASIATTVIWWTIEERKQGIPLLGDLTTYGIFSEPHSVQGQEKLVPAVPANEETPRDIR